jgi:CRISPR-associated protein Csx14
MSTGQFQELFVFVTDSTPQSLLKRSRQWFAGTPPIIPHCLRIITTLPGKRAVINKLIKEGVLDALCQEYDLPRIALQEHDIVVLKNHAGQELTDLWTVEENEAAADQLIGLLRELAADPGTRLHCSLAGGRKTLSYFIGLAFQLVARQWNRLYHVLISSDFEKFRTSIINPAQTG